MTTLPIITANDRIKEKNGIKGCIFGPWGIGKTSLLWTLPTESTLFFDLEAGDLAVEGWQGDTIRPKTWQECRDFAVLIGGANPSLAEHEPYSQAHDEAVCSRYGGHSTLDKYETIFIDSITVAGRLCFRWCQQSILEKAGREDTRAAYGLQAREMLSWLTHLQHARNKNIWFVGILDEKLDEFSRKIFVPQIEGNKTGNELPGIVDQVITMAEIKTEDGANYRAFVNHTLNPYGYPAKDRSGRLDMLEEPHLGKLMAKIKGTAKPITERLIYSTPEMLTQSTNQGD